MSIVGPRPQLVRDMVFMTDEQRKRHDVRPGLSGLAQVNGRNDIDWEDKLNWDMSPITNKFIELPMKSIWNRWVFREKFDNDNPICFIFFAGRNKEINNGVIYYLRSKYKNCKMVLFYQDLVKKSALPQIEKIRNQFDLILSFDQLDVKKYNLLYYPLGYSQLLLQKNHSL